MRTSSPRCGELDVHPVVATLDREAADRVVESLRRPAGERVVVVAVPRAPQPPVLDAALTERSTLVRTAVVEGAVPVADPTEGDRAPVDRDCAHAAVVETVDLGDLVPFGGHRPTPA